MGGELIRKYVTSSMIICYRSVVRHPFLLGMIVFLFSMYRFFPLLFSIVVSASPVLVSTAVLLGTLLSFGQPNIPEIEEESESERAEIQKLESMVMSRTEIVGRDGSFGSEETNGSKIEVADKSFEEMIKVNDDNSCLKDNRPVNLVDDRVIQFGETEIEMSEEKVVLGSHYSPLQQSEDDHIVLESDKLWEGSADPLNSNSGLLWKGLEVHGDDDDDDDGDDDDDDDDGSDSGDSGSDIAESSSPDASMADIIPMLDELHPLLSEEQETHQPSHMSDDGTDAVSQHSLESSDTSSESNDDTDIENHENLKTVDDEDENENENENEDEDEDKESEHIDKEDDIRSAITWTEDDQKNLMNLGTSEMERNRRLENLIARRRARKTMRMQAEKNLIDLESSDLPWNIPPISTTRNNPFDYDSNDNIPGSAPSVLLQRRNPFDLPYDSSEEKPDLVGDTFQQEFAVIQPKEPFFRRHESFNVGPSIFAASRSERQETRLKPYFVPERSFASFQRQFSGLSDSKASSVPDTESVSSDIENKDQIEEDEHSLEAEHVSEIDEHVSDHVNHGRPYFVPEHVATDETSFSFQRQLSEVSESKLSSESDSESDSGSSDNDIENKDHIDLSQEPDLISVEDHEQDHEHVSYVNESLEEDENVEPTGLDQTEISVESVTRQQELQSSGSSLSSSDEASEQIYNEKESDDDVATGSVSEANYFLDRGDSIERSETGVTSLLVEESQPNEPVYDLSPRSVTRNLSSSSIVIDLQKDESFQHTDDHNQLPVVPDNEKHMSVVDNISTTVSDEHVFVAEGVLLDLGECNEVEQVQDSSSDSHARFHEIFDLEDEESLLGGSTDKQAHDLEHDEVTLPNYEEQFTEVIHGETQEELPLLDTSVNELSEENPQVLQVQITSNNSENLQLQEPNVVEVTDIETKTQEISAYASDTQSIEGNIDDVDEIDEDLLVELDAVGDFGVNDFGSTLNEMKGDPHTSEDDLENKEIADEDSYNNDLESHLSEMKQFETSNFVDEDSFSKDLGSTSNEMKREYDIETKCLEDDESDSKDLGTISDEMKQDQHVLDHALETTVSGDEDSDSKVLGSTTLDEMKQGPHDSNHDLETKHSEDEEEDEDFYSKDATFDEIKPDPRDSNYDLETKLSEDKDSYSTLNEMKQGSRDSNHDLENKHFEDKDSYFNDATLDEIKQDPHDSNEDLEIKHTEDEDSYSKDATLDEFKQGPHESNYDLENKHSEDKDSFSNDATLDEIKEDPHDSNQDLEIKHSEDEDSCSKDATLDELKQGPQDSNQDLELKPSGDEDSFSKDLDTTFNEMKKGANSLEHRLETFYSVDENFYSKHVESTFIEMTTSDQDLETNHSGETEIKTDAEVTKSQNEDDISKSKLTSDANESVLPKETESTSPLTNSVSATTVNHETDNALTTSNADKE